MSDAQILDEPLPFASHPSVDVRLILEEARQSCTEPEKTIQLLERAQALDPEQLEVYYRLYKYLFYNKYLSRAEMVARQGLRVAARQAGLLGDWLQLSETSADWCNAEGSIRFYLFTLKALAFILLRQGQVKEAGRILDKLEELDTNDQVGASVIRQLLTGLMEQDDAA